MAIENPAEFYSTLEQRQREVLEPILKGIEKVVYISPHFDDVTAGTSVLNYFAKQTEIPLEEIIIFGRSNYITGDNEGNKDRSELRVEYSTAIRRNEELTALETIGGDRILLNVWEEDESLVRGYSLGEYETGIERPTAFDPQKDSELIVHLRERFKQLLEDDTLLFVPLGTPENVDHLLTRMAFGQANESKQKSPSNLKIGYYIDPGYFSYYKLPQLFEPARFLKTKGFRIKSGRTLVPVDPALVKNTISCYKSQQMGDMEDAETMMKNTGSHQVFYFAN